MPFAVKHREICLSLQTLYMLVIEYKVHAAVKLRTDVTIAEATWLLRQIDNWQSKGDRLDVLPARITHFATIGDHKVTGALWHKGIWVNDYRRIAPHMLGQYFIKAAFRSFLSSVNTANSFTRWKLSGFSVFRALA